MGSYTKVLGRLQQKILKHILECTAESENTSHIADSFRLKQPTVHKSVQSLIDNNYLEFEQEHPHTEKKLTVTPKGAAAAIVIVGADFNELKDYTERRHLDDKYALKFLMKLLTTLVSPMSTERNKYTFKKAMEYYLKNNYFDAGNLKKLTDKQRGNFQRFIVVESLKYSQDSKSGESANTIKEFIDKIGIDKKFIHSYLFQSRLVIDKILSELETE